MKCIYCLKNDTEVTFSGREHVIPQSLGTFDGLNPTVGLVCDFCNSTIFSKLETNFIEDTLEGYQAQRLDFQNRKSITMRNDNFKIDFDIGLANSFFNQMLFPLKPENGRLVPYLKSQVRFNGMSGFYCRVFFPEALKRIKQNSSAFKKITSDMKKLSRKDMAVFAGTHEELDEIIELLGEYGVPYNEKERHNESFEENQKIELNENYECKINHSIGRVLAKIAFNYFAYCCIQDGKEDFLFSENFDGIRNFAYKGESELRDFIPSIQEPPILYEEHISGKRLITHMVNFIEEEGVIVLRITFFGCPAIYRIILGRMPEGMTTVEFGCGHCFDPFSRRIINMANRETPAVLSSDQQRLTFGTNKRFRFGRD